MSSAKDMTLKPLTNNNPKHWILDCDGVLLNSNEIKSNAFYDLALPFGEDVAQEFMTYHKANGGISRYEKIDYLLRELAPFCSDIEGKKHELIHQYGDIVESRLCACEETPFLREFLTAFSGQKVVVSGGMQTELREIFRSKGLQQHFTGIYGSPRSKEQILLDIQEGIDFSDAVFIGDSRLDFEVARKFEIDFIFMKQFTEVKNWQAFFKPYPEVKIIHNLGDLLQQVT